LPHRGWLEDLNLETLGCQRFSAALGPFLLHWPSHRPSSPQRRAAASLQQGTSQEPNLNASHFPSVEPSSVTLSFQKNMTLRIVDSMALLASRLECMDFCTFISPFLTSADIESTDMSLNSVSNVDNCVETIANADRNDCKLLS